MAEQKVQKKTIMNQIPMPQPEQKNALFMGGEELVMNRASIVDEIERRRAVCENMGAQLTPDVDGWGEARNLVRLRLPNQQCFLYSVSHKKQCPRGNVPKIAILGFFPNRDHAKQWFLTYKNHYDNVGNVFVENCISHDLVICVDQKNQVDPAYKLGVATDVLGRYLQNIASRRQRFEQEIANPELRAKPIPLAATQISNASAKNKPQKSSRDLALKALQKKQQIDDGSVAGENKEKEQQSLPLSRDCYQRYQFAVISIVPDNRPKICDVAPEPCVRVYAGFEDRQSADAYIDSAKDIVQNTNLYVVEMYVFPPDSLQSPPKDIHTRYRHPEMDKIMHAPELVHADIVKYENHCREQRNAEPETIEIDLPKLGELPKHSMAEYEKLQNGGKPQGQVTVENLKTIDWKEYEVRKDSLMIMKDGQTTQQMTDLLAESNNNNNTKTGLLTVDEMKQAEMERKQKAELARQRLANWSKQQRERVNLKK